MELQELQTTIAKPVSFTGIGLHTGNSSTLVFKPAVVDSGIKFVRSDLPGSPEIPAEVSYVKDISRGTTIGLGEAQVHTVEHILAAVRGMGIDNVTIELDANEPPVGDGSSLPFFNVLKEAGTNIQGEPRRYFELKEPVYVAHNDMYVAIFPDKEFRVSFTTSYPHPLLKDQYCSLVIDRESFEREIAPARTFCFENEVETLRAQGLIKGGSLDNAIVIGQDGIRNESLRFDDEFVRHKVLDIVGDLTLLGMPLKAHVIAIKSGHALNVSAVQKVYQLRERSKKRQATDSAPREYSMQKTMDIHDIQNLIPHRYPFLLIDRIVDVQEGKRATGLKNVTINEEFFNGHFPGHPIMPGVLIVEAIAQTAAVMLLGMPQNRGKLAYFMSLDQVKFRRPVLPGDQLILKSELIKVKAKGKVGVVKGEAYVGDQLVTQGEFKFSVVEE